MRIITLTSILIFMSLGGSAQTVPKQSAVSQQKGKEIDRLYQKYKDMETVTIYSTFGEIVGDVTINVNPDDKPESIVISGDTKNSKAIDEIVSNLEAQKKRQGYILYSHTTTGVDFDEESHEFISSYQITYKKGPLYFYVTVNYYERFVEKQEFYSALKPKNPFDPSSLHGYKMITETGITFSIENGDNSRKGGSKASNFDF